MDRKTVEKLSACGCYNLRKAARAVTQMFDSVLRPTGLRVTQFTILTVVAASKSGEMTQLAEKLVMERTTLTRNLRPLVNQGLVRILPGADQRTREITLTEKGRHVLSGAIPLWEKTQARFLSGLDGQWPNMLSKLSNIVEAVQKS